MACKVLIYLLALCLFCVTTIKGLEPETLDSHEGAVSPGSLPINHLLTISIVECIKMIGNTFFHHELFSLLHRIQSLEADELVQNPLNTLYPILHERLCLTPNFHGTPVSEISCSFRSKLNALITRPEYQDFASEPGSAACLFMAIRAYFSDALTQAQIKLVYVGPFVEWIQHHNPVTRNSRLSTFASALRGSLPNRIPGYKFGYSSSICEPKNYPGNPNRITIPIHYRLSAAFCEEDLQQFHRHVATHFSCPAAAAISLNDIASATYLFVFNADQTGTLDRL